jgi:hypothetical protein
MERVPAAVISGVAAPEAAHAERPAHLHHAVLVARDGSQIQTNGARKQTGGGDSRARKQPGRDLSAAAAEIEGQRSESEERIRGDD